MLISSGIYIMDKRKSNRFQERRKEIDRQCVITFTQHFAPNKSYTGELHDLSENAVKVIVDEKYKDELFEYFSKANLMKFRFADSFKITVTISHISRIDSEIPKLKNKIGVVMFFDVLSEEDKKIIREIIDKYK